MGYFTPGGNGSLTTTKERYEESAEGEPDGWLPCITVFRDRHERKARYSCVLCRTYVHSINSAPRAYSVFYCQPQ